MPEATVNDITNELKYANEIAIDEITSDFEEHGDIRKLIEIDSYQMD